MSGIGFWELIILSLIGLIVLGPERLPRVANQLGSWLGQARRMTRVMKRQLEEELDFDDEFKIKPPSRDPSSQPAYTPPRDDDEFSAAHGPGEVGTGVGSHSKDAAEQGSTSADGGSKTQPDSENKTAASEKSAPGKKSTKESS